MPQGKLGTSCRTPCDDGSDRVFAQHSRLDRLLDDGDLALIDLEVDQFRRLRFFPRQFLLGLPPEVVFRQLTSFGQPSCTIEVLPVSARMSNQG